MNKFKDLPPTPVTGADFIPPDLSLPLSPHFPIPCPDSSTLPPHSSDANPTATSDTHRWVVHENDSENEEDEESAENVSSDSPTEYPPLAVQPSYALPRLLTRVPTLDTSAVSFAHTSMGWLDLSTSNSSLPQAPPVPPKDPKLSSRVKRLPLPLRLPSS
jgi:hypothetical protein